MKIQILGTGCAKCDCPTNSRRSRISRILRVSGVLATPALAVDGKVRLVDKVATPAEIRTWLR